MTRVETVPEIDAAVGMSVYLTSSPGIRGKIRQRVEDFTVDEVYEEHYVLDGRYQLVKVTKSDTETHHLVRDLSRRLKISQKRISWAGTKDKRAVTTQRMSIDSIRLEEPLVLGNVVMEPVGRSDIPVSLGELLGNDFSITIRTVEGAQDDIARTVESVIDEIRSAGGVPNFFGIQRFGSIRPINHLVGRALVEGDVERAVMMFLARPFADEREDAKEARQFLSDTNNFKEALQRMPLRLRYERAMLNHLTTHPNDFDGALDSVSTNLQKLFVHAFQSFLFNKMVSSRLSCGLSLSSAFDGDRVRTTDKGRLRTVVPKNIQDVNELLEAGLAAIQMPVPGYDSELSDGVIGQIERETLALEGVDDLDAFKIESCPRLASKGVMRDIIVPIDIGAAVGPDECTKDRTKVELRFFLPKGSYATTALREIMKTRLL